MTNDLGWYRRMSERAAEREQARLKAETAVEAEREAQELAEDEARSHQSERYQEGPPGGCHVCYSWSRHFKFHTWDWYHGELVDPAHKVWQELRDEEGVVELVNHCMHSCHGSNGLAMPIIALAAC